MLARAVTLDVLGQTGGRLLAFVGAVALARLLGPADRGLLALMLLASTVPIALVCGGFPLAVGYFASRSGTLRPALLGHSLLMATGLAGLFVSAYWFLRHPIGDLLAQGRGGNAWLLVGLLVPILFLSYTTMNHVWGRLRFAYATVLNVLTAVIHVALVLIVVGALGWGVAGGLLAALGAGLVVFLGGLPVMLADGRPEINWVEFRAMLRYGLLVQVGTVSAILNYRLDVFVLQRFEPLDAVGHYVVAQTVAEIVMILALGFHGSLLTLVARSEGADRSATTIAAVRHHSFLAFVAVVAVAAVGPLLITRGFGPAFRDALVPMLILLPGMWMLGTGTVVAGDLQGRGRPGTASLLALIAVIVTLGLDLALIPPLGVPGAALASLAAYTVFGVLSLAVLSRVCGVSVRTLVVLHRSELASYAALLGRVWRVARTFHATQRRKHIR